MKPRAVFHVMSSPPAWLLNACRPRGGLQGPTHLMDFKLRNLFWVPWFRIYLRFKYDFRFRMNSLNGVPYISPFRFRFRSPKFRVSDFKLWISFLGPLLFELILGSTKFWIFICKYFSKYFYIFFLFHQTISYLKFTLVGEADLKLYTGTKSSFIKKSSYLSWGFWDKVHYFTLIAILLSEYCMYRVLNPEYKTFDGCQ